MQKCFKKRKGHPKVKGSLYAIVVAVSLPDLLRQSLHKLNQ